jgi:multicomponent Na+:H+ antiporter subunit E
MFKKYKISGIKISKPYILLNYLFNLVIDIVRANINVAKIVLSPRMPISPGMVRYRTKLKSDVGKVMLATSITLTPGTLTVDVEGDEFLVHVLTKENALGLTDWGIEEKIMKMEG